MRYLNWLHSALNKDEKAKHRGLKIERLEVSGLGATREAIIRRAFREVVNQEVTTLEELNDALQESIRRAHALQIFDKVDVEIDAGEHEDEGVVVRAKFRECGTKRYAISTYTTTKGDANLVRIQHH